VFATAKEKEELESSPKSQNALSADLLPEEYEALRFVLTEAAPVPSRAAGREPLKAGGEQMLFGGIRQRILD
jgi:hypothetical protein